MTLTERLKEVVGILTQNNVRFALAGGLIASVYRKQERLTNDLDFLFLSPENSPEVAFQILKHLRLEPIPIRKAQLEGGPKHEIKRKTGSVWMILGRASKDDRDLIAVDFILPPMPWFEKALARAEQNLIDFGFGRLPCLTPEDLVLSKFYALSNRSDRFQDLDDLQNIFQNTLSIDLNYLSDQMTALKIGVPKPIEKVVPAILLKTTKLLKRNLKG